MFGGSIAREANATLLGTRLLHTVRLWVDDAVRGMRGADVVALVR